MYPAEEYYYNAFCKVLLKLIGLWPHQTSRFVLLQHVIMIFIIATSICLQLLNFVTHKFTKALFVKIVSMASPNILILIQYCVFVLKIKTIKGFCYQMREDWKIIQDKKEYEIMRKYAHEIQAFTTLLFFIGAISFIAIGILQFLPIILDAVAPLDKPRERNLLIPLEYLLFQNEYFIIKACYEVFCLLIGILTLYAIATQLLIFVYHCLGLFKIASHRIRYSIENIILRISNPIKMDYEIRKGVMLAVVAHRKAMSFADVFISSFNVQYSIILVVGVVTLSITFYRFFEAATVTKEMEDIIMSFCLTICFLSYMFIGLHVAHKVFDCNIEIFNLTYNISWYRMSVSSQKLILLLKQKASKDFYFTIGYIVVIKMESCCMLLNSALSYFAVMYSIQ